MNDKIKQLLENAEQSDAISRNKWRIENREQLREQRKKELKKLMEKETTMSNNNQTTALNEHLEWLKQELQRVIDDGESESWVYAYKRAIKNAESLIEKEKKQIILAITANLPIEDGVFIAIDKAHKYYNETYESNS